MNHLVGLKHRMDSATVQALVDCVIACKDELSPQAST